MDPSVECCVTLFNLSVKIDFFVFLPYLGPKELTKLGSIFFDPPNPLFQGSKMGVPLIWPKSQV